MSTEGTLDLIDGALRDWETSNDAMRWTPDADARGEDRASRMQGMTPSLVIYDEVAMTMYTAAVQRQIDALAAALSAHLPGGMRFEWVSSTPDDPETTQMWTAPRTGWYQFVHQPDMAAGHRAHAIYWPLQHIRCHDCHPIANPRPLAINGDAYRHRQKARRRR